jgi:rhodanese-related sulfurtransferase
MFKYVVNVLICLLLLASCAVIDEHGEDEGEDMTITAADRRISHSQARAWIEQYPDAIILDVRSAAEFATGYIRGAILLPVDDIETLAEEKLPDKNALILVYCRSGIRSHTATLQLMYMGYSRVYDFGGIIDWPYGKKH